jgi:hypothetical protein
MSIDVERGAVISMNIVCRHKTPRCGPYELISCFTDKQQIQLEKPALSYDFLVNAPEVAAYYFFHALVAVALLK